MATKDLVAASTRPLLLAVLSASESYGYEIIQRVQSISGGTLSWSDGMLYPVLHRLEKEGLIRSRWGSSETGRRRRYYALTPEGRATLREEKAQWQAVDRTLRKAWSLAT